MGPTCQWEVYIFFFSSLPLSHAVFSLSPPPVHSFPVAVASSFPTPRWATSSRQPDRNVLGNEAWAGALGRTSRSQPWRGPFSPPGPCHGLLSGTSIRISLPCLLAFCYCCTTKDFITTCSVHIKSRTSGPILEQIYIGPLHKKIVIYMYIYIYLVI